MFKEKYFSYASFNRSPSFSKSINETVWDIEDDIRLCEQRGDFGDKFIKLARSVYRQNDKRAAVKKEINVLLGSSIIEEKSYADYMQE